MKNIMILLSFVLFLQGCATRGTGGSYVGNISNFTASENIIADLLFHLSEKYPSGHTELSLLTPEENAENEFSLTLENELRKKGYTIAQNANLTLSYQIDILESSEYYLQVEFDDFSITRMYDASGNPSSNWAQKVKE